MVLFLYVIFCEVLVARSIQLNLFGYVQCLWYSITMVFNLLMGRKNKLVMILDVCLDLSCTHKSMAFPLFSYIWILVKS